VYVTVSRSRSKSKTNYSLAEKVAERGEGRLFRRGRKSIEKVVAEATRHGEDTVLIIGNKGKKRTQKTIKITDGSYRWQ
jgi:rRNA maturation protein Rpf1